MLNSERIEQQYGSYGIEVLSDDGSVRVSDLYSGSGDGRVCRTFAVVVYADPVNVDERTHREITAGGSLGATLKANGYGVEKHTRSFHELPADPGYGVLYKRMKVPPTDLAVHVYELWVERGSERSLYASIAEFHHPGYLSEARLAEIYPVETSYDRPGLVEMVETSLEVAFAAIDAEVPADVETGG